MKDIVYRLLSPLFLVAFLLVTPVIGAISVGAAPISPLGVEVQEKEAGSHWVHLEGAKIIVAEPRASLSSSLITDSPLSTSWKEIPALEKSAVTMGASGGSAVVITVAGGLAVVKVLGASGTVVATITAGAAAYKAFDFLDSVGSRIEDARELAEILSDNKEEVAKYAKMSYDTLYSLCHDKGGGMMSVPSVQDVKGEIEEDYIFGVPEKNAVCVAN